VHLPQPGWSAVQLMIRIDLLVIQKNYRTLCRIVYHPHSGSRTAGRFLTCSFPADGIFSSPCYIKNPILCMVKKQGFFPVFMQVRIFSQANEADISRIHGAIEKSESFMNNFTLPLYQGIKMLECPICHRIKIKIMLELVRIMVINFR
jgi:hypothetical protein